MRFSIAPTMDWIFWTEPSLLRHVLNNPGFAVLAEALLAISA
jgi:hypothetical protein